MLLKKHLESKKLILGSSSIRRKELLKSLEIPFVIKYKNFDETYPNKLKKEEITDFISKKKAKLYLGKLKSNEILLTADTIVWFKKNAIGKPKSIKNCKEILLNLSNSTHEVVTSICLTSIKKQIIVNACTKVSFRKLHKNEINNYVKKFKPLDKAGGYGVQDWIGKVAVKKIEGSYLNVMGLPLHLLYENLLKF